MKKRVIKGSAIFLLGFVLFFLFRLAYGFTVVPSSGYVRSFDINISNYASRKYKRKGKSKVSLEGNFPIDQKYEKIATITSKSSKFTEDEKKLRTTIQKYEALIQYEQKSGKSGNRKLHLAIGVAPERFDDMIEDVKKIGNLNSIQINKTDKTNEYKNLNAKKISLVKARESLIELKKRNAPVKELVSLEDRILEIENQIQNLGVNLGDYDEENEFCTIKFSIAEVHTSQISMLHRIKVALQWSIKWYIAFLILVVLSILGSLFGLLLMKYLKRGFQFLNEMEK